MARRKSTLSTWLLQLAPEGIIQILLSRRDVAESHPYSLKAMADALASPTSVRSAVDTLDQACLDVLGGVVSLGDRATVESLRQLLGRRVPKAEFDRTLGELHRLALVWQAGDGTLRTVTSLRPDGATPGRVTPKPPTPRVASRSRQSADQSATAPAVSTVDCVTRLVEFCSSEVFVGARRNSGSVATREVRRAATALRVSENKLRLWLELAAEAQLLSVASHDDRLLPTHGFDRWRATHPAHRLAELIQAWQRMNWQPASKRSRSALLDQPGDQGASIRRAVLDRFAAQPDGEAFADTAEVVAELVWGRPALHGPLVTPATITEAESLGLVALGRITSLGRAALVGDDELTQAAERLVPTPTGVARLRADLTAVVSGLPTAELSALLSLAADPAERGTASVWRFSAASVRRALDTGRSADQLLTELTAVAERELPQPLRYLVEDVARRHGQVTVTTVACCVRAEEPALLNEIAGNRSLQALDLKFLAPTVLASAKPAAGTLAALRAAGYAPTIVSADGMSIVDETGTHRAEPRGRRQSGEDRWHTSMTDTEIIQLATKLVERERPPEQVARKAESPRMSNARLLRDQSLFLPDAEVFLLAEALVTATRVEIRYACGPSKTVKYVITPLNHVSGKLTAHCEPKGDAREFLVSHIRSVRVPPPD